jgi:hypothetical protein
MNGSKKSNRKAGLNFHLPAGRGRWKWFSDGGRSLLGRWCTSLLLGNLSEPQALSHDSLKGIPVFGGEGASFGK